MSRGLVGRSMQVTAQSQSELMLDRLDTSFKLELSLVTHKNANVLPWLLATELSVRDEFGAGSWGVRAMIILYVAVLDEGG